MNQKPTSEVRPTVIHTELHNSFGAPHNSQDIPVPCNVENRKRKLSASQPHPFFEQGALEERTLTGEMCNLRKVHTAVQCPPHGLVKRTKTNVCRKELNLLRIQVAMVSDSDGDRPIHVAVAQENLKLVHKLCALMLKASISLDLTNYLRQTPFHLAVMLGNVAIVKLLMKCGSSVTLKDRNGNSVIHLAVKSGTNKEVLGLILSHPDAKNILNALDYEGYSALHYAVLKNNKTAVWCLQKVGAQMNVVDGKSGRSPLIHAILNRNEEMVSLLLECDACAEVSDYSGRSAFELALHASTKGIVQLLEGRLFANDPIEFVANQENSKAPRKITGRTKRNNKNMKNDELRMNL